MTVGDLEDKRVVEPAPTVTFCNTTSISREHNTSTGLWQDSNSKGQHDTSCVLTQWAEGCQSIKVSLNISKLRSASPVSGCLSSNCKASFKHLPTQWHIFLAYWRGCEGTGPGSSGEGRGCSCVGGEGREEGPGGSSAYATKGQYAPEICSLSSTSDAITQLSFSSQTRVPLPIPGVRNMWEILVQIPLPLRCKSCLQTTMDYNGLQWK